MDCPVPKNDYDKILLAHGGGGTLMHRLIDDIFKSNFDNEILSQGNDSAIFEISGTKFAFTTDSYVVQPLFFPGGDIGTLAVNGTVNDLCVSGAKPLYISVGFIIEEGFPIEELEKIVISMKKSAEEAKIKIVTGDTKVINKKSGDGIYINTSGIGIVYDEVNISAGNLKPGDKIILSGKIADHGIAVMSARENLEFETEIKSDCAALNGLVDEIFSVSKNIKVMRDPTRGGVAGTLNEIAKSSGLGIKIYEDKIPVSEPVRGACEILGFDPMYVANEGKLIAFVKSKDAEKVLLKMQSHHLGKESVIIGEVTSENPARVIMKTVIGSSRIVDMISGEQLPRIC
ncbi:MAG: hydrogenase expression/formation protein HypE [Ignavibacteria bacterium]|nr:hydrogenase expression/formation protein HypE [Ignavibacteria bacterium]